MPKPSPVSYVIFALFFAFWGAVALYLIAGGDTAPGMRLLFAVCGILSVYAATMSGLFAWCGRTPRSSFNVPTWARAFLTLLALCAGGFCYLQDMMKESYADTFAKSGMAQQFIALEEYAERHNGTLPPDMRSATVTRYLGIRFRTADAKWHGQPYVWSDKLAGKRIADFPERATVVVLYSQPITKRKTRVVLFLDGRTDYRVSVKELARLLRESDRVIATSKRTKPNAVQPPVVSVD